MTSTGSLQQALKSLDGTAPTIQRAASSMMKHYDQTALVAVTEWRNSLSASTSSSHLISMLYVANEVLQISKRNRGNKFLEAFSAVLGQALQHICRQDPSLTEKVRRTVKIWGERHVFSVRFVNELIKGLDTYRGGETKQPPQQTVRRPATMASSRQQQQRSNLPSSTPIFQDDSDGAEFSPQLADAESHNNAAESTVTPDANERQQDEEKGKDDDSIMDILERHENDDDDDDDEEDIFASDTKLNVDIDLEHVNASGDGTNNSATKEGSNKKRRSSTGDSSTGKRRRRASATSKVVTLSANTLLELSNRVTNSQNDFEDSQRALQRIDNALTKKSTEELEQLVGDDLQAEYRQMMSFQKQIIKERRRLHGIAQERKGLEQEAMAYLPWLEKALQQDQDDIDFCHRLQKELEAFLPIHGELQKARDLRRSEERQRLEKEAERERLRREKEEAERFRQESLKRQTAQEEGMVWNPSTREYQSLDTNESWRDN